MGTGTFKHERRANARQGFAYSNDRQTSKRYTEIKMGKTMQDEVLTAFILKGSVFWDITSCSRRFKRTNHLPSGLNSKPNKNQA
jgi:hypothetical protein